MVATQETVSQRIRKAEALKGLTLRVVAEQGEINRIYGPGTMTIPKGRMVKVLDTKLNHNHPINPSGDIWVRVKELNHGLSMWMLSTWLDTKEDDNE